MTDWGEVGRAAVLSDDGVYRYRLTRTWAPMTDRDPYLVWVMLNPSTADANFDDPTIRKCIGFTQRFGFCGIHVVNLFAYRATDPRKLMEVSDPVGRDNPAWVMDTTRGNEVVAAWGAGVSRTQLQMVRTRAALFETGLWPGQKAWCLGTTKSGMPRHPLYVPYATKFERWELR